MFSVTRINLSSFQAKNSIICKTKHFILKPEIIICLIWIFCPQLKKQTWMERNSFDKNPMSFFVSQSLYYWICHFFLSHSHSERLSRLEAEKLSIIFYVYWCLLDHDDQTVSGNRNEPENTISPGRRLTRDNVGWTCTFDDLQCNMFLQF